MVGRCMSIILHPVDLSIVISAGFSVFILSTLPEAPMDIVFVGGVVPTLLDVVTTPVAACVITCVTAARVVVARVADVLLLEV